MTIIRDPKSHGLLHRCDGCGEIVAKPGTTWRFMLVPPTPYLHPLQGRQACSDRCEIVVLAKFGGKP